MEKTGKEKLLNAIRKEFFALRNGMISDTLRKGGLEQKYIFGLQLPQIKEIAERFRPGNDDESAALARELWQDRECREARLLACHIMPPSEIGTEEATEWAENVATREEADILAFRLIRYLPCADAVATSLGSTDDTLKKYTAAAIRRFI